jgi:hypothetical protein
MTDYVLRIRGRLVFLSKPVKVTDNNTKILTYFIICLLSVHYKFIMFYDTEPFAQCYVTFYTCSLRMLIISLSVYPWQAFPAQSNVFG